MKLSFISDIHVDINKDYPVLEAIASFPCDALVIAGDIYEGAVHTLETVRRLEEMMHIPVYYVPGNHDMWNGDKNLADSTYQLFVSDEHCLCGKPVLLNGKDETFALIGDIGWYDYSFGDSQFSLEDFNRMSYQKRTWQDFFRNGWTADNRKKCEEMLSNLEQKMKQHKEYPQILVTHMLPIREFCVPLPNEIWCYFNAFLGSEKFGELYKRNPVRYGVCGHVHYRKTVQKDGITYICPCLNYAKEWQYVDTGLSAFEQVRRQIEDAIVTVEI